MIEKVCQISNEKPKLKKLLDLLCRIVLQRESGRLEADFSQGSITSASFKIREI